MGQMQRLDRVPADGAPVGMPAEYPSKGSDAAGMLGTGHLSGNADTESVEGPPFDGPQTPMHECEGSSYACSALPSPELHQHPLSRSQSMSSEALIAWSYNLQLDEL